MDGQAREETLEKLKRVVKGKSGGKDEDAEED